jgi:hypothetical protein
MTWSVYQHWDPLKVCVVGRSYPPEFYSWITVPHVRKLFEKIAIETEEDYQGIIKKLESFSVQVLRPDLIKNPLVDNKFLPPPMTPRDHMVMIGDRFYENYTFDFRTMYNDVKDPTWPQCNTEDDFKLLPTWIQEECNTVYNFKKNNKEYVNVVYSDIFDLIRKQKNTIKSHKYNSELLNGAQVSRIGRDLYFGTDGYNQDTSDYKQFVDKEFANTRNHIVDTGGHSDGTYCAVCPGLIISLQDVPTYANTFPGWEVVYLPNQSWTAVKSFMNLKQKNHGKWWIPGFEQDQAVIDVVETWLNHWTGYVEETVFDVNMLIVDPTNVIVFNYNKKVFDALEKYGITPHVVPFRHRYFWDGGIHCVTSDLHREGEMKNYFPERNTD